ncbi:hypothetical protein K504DRAFT_461562 [Pleomassaria siparia CBS 279.74]|uniref:Uncharacterized protein n=1 Tax=Pleomassaria siparia CBS 279.74 TaxID=1314801 RepID=A0A6G1KK23_9PLEO|nr:hypothetical protein K504DRAFT_461562 [Pleomassaria siparia CBS 279.74]
MPLEDDLRWTTSRCNRLLRHISSPLAALRKETERVHKAAGESRVPSTAFATKTTPQKTTLYTQLTSARKPRGFEKAHDPDWVPGTKPTGVKKTYGGRASKISAATQNKFTETVNVGRPGEIAFTPLVARTGGRFQDSPQLLSSPLRPLPKRKGPLIAKGDQLQIKKHMSHDTAKQVEGLLKAYANLLSATALGVKKRWKGTRSLMSACLRQMPAFIELEEHFAEFDKDDDEKNEERDIANEIYLELEDKFEMNPGQGWRPFKSIVRAHGTSMLCNAFADETLKVETLHIVVSHCLDAAAWDEAEKLLWAYLSAMKPLPLPTNPKTDLFDKHRSIYMWMTKKFVDCTGRSRFLYDVLGQMISQELLPLEWLATDSMQSLWHKLVRTLSDGDPRMLGSAFHFLETTLSLGIGLPNDSLFEPEDVDIVPKQTGTSARRQLREALDTTYLSLLTVLSSIALLNNIRADSTNDSTVQRVTSVLDSIVIGLLKRGDVQSHLDLLEPTPEDMETFTHRALWVMSASFLVHLGGCQLPATMVPLEISTLVGAINWVASQYSSKNIGISSALATLPGFISSTARCTGKAQGDDGFDQLQRLADALLSLKGFRLPHKMWTMKRLALESCSEFAQSTNNAEHITYARFIEKSMSEKGRVMLANTPHKSDAPSASGGFRWEEGIGEWVTCTPFAKNNAKGLLRKPIRALDLLPTPVASEDEVEQSSAASSGAGAPTDPPDEPYVWAGNDAFIHSSPVKAPLRKRRSTSPVVVISAKRTRVTPPESPHFLESYSQTHSEPRRIVRKPLSASKSTTPIHPEPRRSRRILAESFNESNLPISSHAEPRRSRRSRKEIKNMISNLRKSRSRTSLDSSLRDISRKTYAEVIDYDESESDMDATDTNGITMDTEDENDDGNNDDRDELSKTPTGVKRRRSGRIPIKAKTPWWVSASEKIDGESSEDELSFH